MNITALKQHLPASDIPAERLAGNSSLTEREKIAEASRQFEAILLRQILDSTQKPMIKSKLSPDSTSAGIYRGLVTEQLADSISKSGAFGLAHTFDRQLNHHAAANLKAGNGGTPDAVAPSPIAATYGPATPPASKLRSPHDS